MTQPNLFPTTYGLVDPAPKFGGETYSPKLDKERLTTAMGRVYTYMLDGRWSTLEAISKATGVSEAGVSARLRDFRKQRFMDLWRVSGMESRRVEGGLWEYRLILRGLDA